MLGQRFLVLTHRGRSSGRVYDTALEVVGFDPVSKESVVVSAYGRNADWYRNLQVQPALRVRTGRYDYAPEQRFLIAEEAREVAEKFCLRHPWEAKVARKVLSAIGADLDETSDSPIELLSQLPMVGFRPRR
jgi:deazaflavin-dependent oxidoreductase (nitroreductase family)